ncbi:HAMP domain-containing sensor histidine kinase [Fredinandcohnia sp. QZ13]|uniref:HAMP domain-containing sensor histidine kinase n=1 Tax=Fredinandcohnia sp. QZ13 TaxID=3073144 RepID=UPI00285330A6|nr:HAMP domain-containing sensor histidine kinase [Fredinandcohnia sp. QZ13]MDR4886831.1 HAMP domain-containing sensor histidine kinase [Fredinandcohnia sp. QZ13]
MEITKHILVNLSLLIILSFIGLIWFERKRNLTLSKWEAYIGLVVLILVCFIFSYRPTPTHYFDLRLIPVLIGGLYLGIGPVLCLTVIVLRGIYGINFGFYATITLYLPSAIILWKLYPWFWKQHSMKRVWVSVLVTFILSFLTASSLLISKPNINFYDAWFAYLVIPAIGLGIMSYLTEYFRNNILMRQTILKSEKLHAVEQLGAAISHEIRNPLTAAMGFVQLLMSNSLPRHKQKEYLLIIKDELRSAERVIQDYLTFSKPALDTVETLQIKRELQQVISILRPTANQHSVEVITNFALVGTIQGDRQKFHQCFINVMKNAIEAMPGGGQLYIETRYDRQNVSIIIRDTGIGMTKEQIDRLGEPYYSTKGSKGTGLGMMVVYGIVKAMKGTLRVTSTVGEGTEFTFQFPSALTLTEPHE